MKSEVIEAIRMLAKEKEISEESLFNTIEEALKAAYKKNLPKGLSIYQEASPISEKPPNKV